ncbi:MULTISPECIES: hypothetical protein [Rhodopirellula]|uniref:hypothetical protein n=1 Tax=Rhodopirellula TaxID=265488 RepID=UPI00257ED214|nr:hypothetical protein [Rhodopirellula sp. UBA1907]|tara:strand:+ start:357 stop:962 length:606 start_codon:yes stop_codon:yes gene_type:complete
MKKAKVSAARRRVNSLRKPGKASDYVLHAQEHLLPGMNVIVAVRVSTDEQEMQAADNEKRCCEFVRSRGAIVLVSRTIRSMGKLPEDWLPELVKLAKEKKDAVILAESVDRFMRSERYTPREQVHHLTERELEGLKALADGVPLLTLLHPDERPRSEQTKRGMKARGNKGGRGRKSPAKVMQMDDAALRKLVHKKRNGIPR